MDTLILIHQPTYSMFNRWIETEGLLEAVGEEGMGCIVFSPLAQGMLSDRYLKGKVPKGSRASRHGSFSPDLLTDETLERVRALNEIAASRGQTLAQMALAWTLRDSRVTSTLVGASSVAQLEENLAALDKRGFSEEELAEIDRHRIGERYQSSGPSQARPDRICVSAARGLLGRHLEVRGLGSSMRATSWTRARRRHSQTAPG